MKNLIELTLADDKDIDIPSSAPVLFIEMLEGKNPNFPKAKTYLQYAIGQEYKSAILLTTVDDLMLDLDINVAPQDWLKLTTMDGERLTLRGRDVVGRLQTDEGCEVLVSVGGDVQTYVVKETRKQIKKWMDRESV